MSDENTRISDGAARGRLMVLSLLAVAVIAGVVAGVAWMRYTKTPAYSLGRLASAIEDRDWDQAQRYVDVEAVASAYVDGLLATAGSGTATATASQGMGASAGGMGGSAGRSDRMRMMKPVFAKRFRDALRQGIKNASVKSGSGGLGSALLAKTPRSVTYAGTQEASVVVEVPAAGGGTSEATLVMRRSDDHWRIVAVDDISDLLGSLD